MTNTSKNAITTWADFKSQWHGIINFLIKKPCFSFDFPLPDIAQIVDILRRDTLTQIGPGAASNRLITDDYANKFRALPLEKALESSFGLAHYRLSQFDAKGKFLHHFGDKILEPWKQALTNNGFTFERCYPIIFISGVGCATNYHLDFSHVLAWQTHGEKRFCGLQKPAKWLPTQTRLNYKPSHLTKPDQLTDNDALCFQMKPCDILWNTFMTPHWVQASDQIAMSINISHGGLRLNGKLCPWEQELEDYRQANPKLAPQKFNAQY